jgi:D-alanyl-D-alanine carboxypeptidase/D-alanyl-D-alanine-endopeptidase (penicillin-binding protein 4)
MAMTGRRGHRTLRVVLVVAFVAVAAAVGGVALYASTSEDSGGTSAAGAGAAPTAVTPSAATPSAATPSVAPVSALPAASAPPAVPALWQRTAASAAPLLSPVLLSAADDPTTAGLTAALTPLLADHAFAGDEVAMLVADAATGRVLLDHDSADVVPPASTAKLAVAVAALQVLGPDARLTTRVVQGSGPSQVVLVGGGDPTLSGPAAVGLLSPGYPAPASLTTLAQQTATELHARGITAVTLGYDASLFVGATLAPGWKPIYQTEGDVAPVSALEVDEGHPNPARTATAADPAAAAASEFAALLTSNGVAVTGVPTAVRAGATQASAAKPTLASVASPPMSELVQRMLGRSDNDLAEALSRQVAIATGHPASFAGGVAAVKAAIVGLGVDSAGLSTVDASGLSPLDRVKPAALLALLRLAIVPGHDRLAPILTGLPVAGFSGTLSGRFGGPAAAGAGLIRAKTGTLDGVVALAGYLQDSSGATLVFATIVTGVAKTATVTTEAALDRLTASLPACGCR